jgi:hypothetical protein
VAVRVRFAPSPTGSLHLGNALTAVANRHFADSHRGVLLLRIDDTDPARTVERGQEAILEDLAWLGLTWEEGPVRQSERRAAHAEAVSARLPPGTPSGTRRARSGSCRAGPRFSVPTGRRRTTLRPSRTTSRSASRT